jgi:hypothetical protein
MRTINKTLYSRLIAQAEEAEIQGLTKIADMILDQTEKNAEAIRSDEASYNYSSEELEADVEKCFWDAAVRVADYHDKSFDAKHLESIIKECSRTLLNELRASLQVEHGVGAFESTVPGEVKQRVVIAVEEDE